MTEKEILISFIDRLGADEIAALNKIVKAMVYPSYPEEELTPDEEVELSMAIDEIQNGDVHVFEGENLDGLFVN